MTPSNSQAGRSRWKNLLQELCQRNRWDLPNYETKFMNDLWSSSVRLNNRMYSGLPARRKVDAEQSAAHVAYSAVEPSYHNSDREDREDREDRVEHKGRDESPASYIPNANQSPVDMFRTLLESRLANGQSLQPIVSGIQQFTAAPSNASSSSQVPNANSSSSPVDIFRRILESQSTNAPQSSQSSQSGQPLDIQQVMAGIQQFTEAVAVASNVIRILDFNNNPFDKDLLNHLQQVVRNKPVEITDDLSYEPTSTAGPTVTIYLCSDHRNITKIRSALLRNGTVRIFVPTIDGFSFALQSAVLLAICMEFNAGIVMVNSATESPPQTQHRIELGSLMGPPLSVGFSQDSAPSSSHRP